MKVNDSTKTVDDHNHDALRGYRASDAIKSVEILATKDSCTACKAAQGKVIALDEVVATPPLPIKECTRKGGCRCCYLPVI